MRLAADEPICCVHRTKPHSLRFRVSKDCILEWISNPTIVALVVGAPWSLSISVRLFLESSALYSKCCRFWIGAFVGPNLRSALCHFRKLSMRDRISSSLMLGLKGVGGGPETAFKLPKACMKDAKFWANILTKDSGRVSYKHRKFYSRDESKRGILRNSVIKKRATSSFKLKLHSPKS